MRSTSAVRGGCRGRFCVTRSAAFSEGLSGDPADEDRGTDLGPVILDEILPHRNGCRHEVACWDGTLTIVCRDLRATWIETICSSKA
ncbi:hypothetical protein ACFWV1_14400 [Streptomyces sp. NPDC058700]|uniref:hypothetical protein n=1 Tax=unclassified Streptomyces TaxID=2593676 RepID=UPI00365316B6